MDEETIKKARQAHLANYLLSVGVPLVRYGNRYKHKEHDSLTFTANAYYWNSRQESGNSIDYLMRHMDMTFQNAVITLIDFDVAKVQTSKEFNFQELKLNSNLNKVKAYLNKTRYIGYSIIEHLAKNNLLFQEKQTNNAIFPMYDENNIIIGAEMQGILVDKRFKGIKAGSKYGYGFNVKFSDDNTFEYALFFESAVDLISFIDYKFNHDKKNLNKCILISMAGLKPNILHHTLNAFKGNLKVVLCVDNDEAGQMFKNKVESEKIPYTACTPNEKFKDWNEQITAWRNNKAISRVLERYNNNLENKDKTNSADTTIISNKQK